MDNPFVGLVVVLVLLAYIVYFKPKAEEKAANALFDSRVLSVIDGLYLAGLRFRCSLWEMQGYAKDVLRVAHLKPGNACYIEYTAKSGFVYRAHVCSDHALFALICILQYAACDDNAQLTEQCEALLGEARLIE